MRVGHRFGRVDLRRRMRAYVHGLIGPVGRKNSWQLAEHAGHRTLLPGYKGPDIHSRGESPEDDAFFFLDELEAIIREWTAAVYHCRPQSSLVDLGMPGLRMSPAKMFEHGMAWAGYIEAAHDRDLAYEFLQTKWRTVQHYGVGIGRRRYSGPGLPEPGIRSPYDSPVKNGWPFQVDPDDVTKIYFRIPQPAHGTP